MNLKKNKNLTTYHSFWVESRHTDAGRTDTPPGETHSSLCYPLRGTRPSCLIRRLHILAFGLRSSAMSANNNITFNIK